MFDLSKLSAAELDDLIAHAAKLREAREPAVAMNAPIATSKEPQQVQAVVRPPWWTMATEHGSLIQIRHPGLGWLTFIIPPDHRAQLLGLLLNQALIVPPAGTLTAAPPPAAGGSLH